MAVAVQIDDLRVGVAEITVYARGEQGPDLARSGVVSMGTDSEPVPVTGLAANFLPMPRMAPPPLGRLVAGDAVAKVWEADAG